MKQCFGYVRVSTVRQGDGVSLEAQREAIEYFAERNDITISQWFEEQQTAAKRGRPVFAKMIAALKHRQADGVVMHKVDRSARNIADWGKVGELADAGIDVHFASESMDFNSRGGRLSADIQAVIAADYIRNLKEETRKGIRGRLKQGLYPFNAPLGYRNHGKGQRKTIDPRRGPLVREMFELYATGQYSLHSLVPEMKQRRLRNRHGKPLTKASIEKILNNPFYCGLMRIKTTGDTYPGNHNPLISVRLFDRVQAVKAGKYGKKVTRHNHLFRGLFRCQLCGMAMIPERQKTYIYYRCHIPTCPTKCVNETAVEDAIRIMLAANQINNDMFQTICESMEQWQQKRQSDTTGANTIDMELGRIKDRLDRLTDALIDQVIDEDTFKTKQAALRLEEARLHEQQAEQQKKSDDPARLRTFLERLKTLTSYYDSLHPAEKREFIDWTTSNRTVANKNVLVEPSNWLLETRQVLGVSGGAPPAPTSRTFERLIEIEKQVRISRSKSRDSKP